MLLSTVWEHVKSRTVQIHNPLRKDRATLTRAWTHPFGIKLKQFDAIMRPDGAEGCLLSHSKVAQLYEAPYVVLEDDAVPTNEANYSTELIASLQEIMKQKFDIIYLGGLPIQASSTSFPGIYTGQCWTTYAMIVGPKAAQYLKTLRYENVPVDVLLARQSFNCAIVDPPLFRQAITPSEIGKSRFTKSLFFSHALASVGPVWRFAVLKSGYLMVLVLFLGILVGILK